MKSETALIICCSVLAFATNLHAQQSCDARFRGWGDLDQGLPAQGACASIAAGRDFMVQLLGDGSLVAYGAIATPPSGQFLAVAGGFGCCGNRSDRRVVAWGLDHYGQTNVLPGLPDAGKVTTLPLADLHGDGQVSGADLGILLARLGPCQ